MQRADRVERQKIEGKNDLNECTTYGLLRIWQARPWRKQREKGGLEYGRPEEATRLQWVTDPACLP